VSAAKRWRQAFDRIGGPDAVTWPAFWITFVGSLIGNLTTGGAIATPLGTRIVIIAITQLAMFAPLLLLRLTVLRDPPRPRPWVAIGGFALACVVRGVLLSFLLVMVGAVTEPLYVYRIIASLVGSGSLLVLVALVVSTMRAHTRSLKQLVAVQRDLADAQRRIVAEVAERNEQALSRVKDRLADELSALEASSGAASVAELQRLASDVVRPMSHALASSMPAWEDPKTDIADVHVTWQQAVDQMAKSSALRPVQTAFLMAAMLVVSAAGIYGLLGLQLMLAVSVSLLIWAWLANKILGIVLPRLSAGPGLAVLVLMSGVVGFLSGAVASWVMRETGLALTFLIAGSIYIAGLTFFVALVNGVFQQQRSAEAALSFFSERLRREVVRLRQAQWLQRKALSRALHGPVQSAVTAAAFRLDAAVREGQPTSGLLEDIREQLRSVVDVLETDEAVTISFDHALERITGTWEGVCDVETIVSTDAAARLDRDPLAISTVVDILTEAVSNAVRHAQATHVRIDVQCDAGSDLLVMVSDNGYSEDDPAAASAATGLGTLLLDECTLIWSRGSHGAAHILKASVPTLDR
jgi:signal transduction histidine kinase